MKLNSRFTIAVHTVLCIAYSQDSAKITSEFIAGSVNVNPVIIRKILASLQKAGLVYTKAGVGGSYLNREIKKITLLDIYKAVSEESEEERSVFNFTFVPNPACPVGCHLHDVLDPSLKDAQAAMEAELSKTTIFRLVQKLKKENGSFRK